MQTAKSRVVTRLKGISGLGSALLLTGCSLSPSIPVIGAYYPDWLFCILAGVILTLITCPVIVSKTGSTLAFPAVIYTALFVLYSMLFWLVFF